MTPIEIELTYKVEALRVREAAAYQLLGGETGACNKRADLVAKLPDTERKLASLVAKWEAQYMIDPSEYSYAKYERARIRLANTQRQRAKVSNNPMTEELKAIREEIAALVMTLATLARHESEKQKLLWDILTERYAIDNITGGITVRATGSPVTAPFLTVNSVRHPIETVRQILLTGGLV